MRMLEGKSTAPGDVLGCGVCYGAAPSAQFLPQADIWPLRALPCFKPMVPPLRVWPRQAIEWQGSGSKAPPPAGTRAVGRCQQPGCFLCTMYYLVPRVRWIFRWADFGFFSSVELVRAQGGLYALLTQRPSRR